VGTKPGYVYAATVNDSGHVLGQYCYSEGTCLWLLGLRTRCSENEKYPALVNADAGAQSIEIYCAGELPGTPGLYTYAFTEFDKVTEFVTKSNRVGIAIPLQSDEFRVIRFDLNGASAAIASMQKVAAQKTRPARQGTRDQKL
jgi:hypothetical protein